MDYVKLGDLCVINSGGTPRRNNESYWKNGDIPWVKIGDLNNGIVESTEEFITLDGLKNSSAKIFPSGTLLYTIFATIGEVAILNIDAATNQAIVGLQLKENQKVYLKYIYYYLKSQTNIIKQLGRGVAQNNINLSVVKDMIIHIVSLEKQSNIIATLSKLEKIKENRIIILNYLDGLIKSRFDEVFNLPLVNTPLSKYIKELKSGKSLAGESYNINKVLKTGAVSFDYFNNKEVKNLPIAYTPLENHRVNVGDVIISRMNTAELVGAAGYVWSVDDNVYLPDRLWNAILDENINPIFVWQLLIHKKTKIQIQRIATGTSGSMKNISKQKFLDIKVPWVPINTQNELSNLVCQINKLKSDVQKSIDETQLLMDSLMQEYFG